MIKISNVQLLCLIILFEIGSTTLFAIGIQAKQDAWIAILIALFVGCGLVWMYTRIQHAYPEQHLGDILLVICGKWIGGMLVFLYALYFLYVGATNFWEFGQVTILLLLPETPQEAVLIGTLLLMCYACFLGLEVIGRTGVILIPYFLLFLTLILLLTAVSDKVEFNRLQPVLENGIMPVIHAAIPHIISFPFGESIVFLVYLKHLHTKKDMLKTFIMGIGISGLLLTATVLMMITVLGAETASYGTIPLRRLARTISIAGFIQNIDGLAIVAFFIGGFFKMTLHFYAGVILIQSLFKIQKPIWVILPAGACVFWFSITFFSSLVFQRWIGFNYNTSFIIPVFGIIFPCLLLLIIWIQKRIQQHRLSKASSLNA